MLQIPPNNKIVKKSMPNNRLESKSWLSDSDKLCLIDCNTNTGFFVRFYRCFNESHFCNESRFRNPYLSTLSTILYKIYDTVQINLLNQNDTVSLVKNKVLGSDKLSFNKLAEVFKFGSLHSIRHHLFSLSVRVFLTFPKTKKLEKNLVKFVQQTSVCKLLK